VTPLTRLIGNYIHGVKYAQIPKRVVEPLRQSIADTIGCGLLGSTTAVATLLRNYTVEWRSAGDAVIWGTGSKASAPLAAMANCASCHAWDYDDAVLPAVIHPGSLAIPTALAIAERRKTPTTGKDFITAVAAGYEVGNLMGAALGAKAFASDGFYNSVPAIFVAATTATKLMRLNKEQAVRAIGLAATQAAGLYSATVGKRFNSPKASMGGIMAADLALRGLEMSSDSIEAEYSGFLKTFSRAPFPGLVERDLGRYNFEIFHKFYPCIRSNHPTVENIKLALDENPDVKVAQIVKLVAHVDQLTVDYTEKTTAGGAVGVKTVGNALVSFHYCVAAMALDRELTFRQFTPAKIRRREVQSLMRKIELRADPAIDALPATSRYRCSIELYLEDGRILRRQLIGPKGDPNNRLTVREMRAKFMENATTALPAKRAGRLFDLLEDVESIPDMRAVSRLLAVPG